MADVSRALLLPDIAAPADSLLKTLALYWDEIIVPDYQERMLGRPHSELSEVDEGFLALEAAGIVKRETRVLEPDDPSDAFIPHQFLDRIREGKLNPDPAMVEAIGPEDLQGVERLTAVFGPALDAFAPIMDLPDPRDFRSFAKEHREELEEAAETTRNRIVDYAVQHYLVRLHDAFNVAGANNLAPLSRSTLSHIGSMVGPEIEGLPNAEAAILSAAVEAFEVDPSTSVEEIVAVREKHAASLGRLRASLADLSEGLRQTGEPSNLLSQARDTYRNRVMPALGDLEAALAKGRIQFFLKSLIRASAVTLAPVDPMHAVEGGAQLVGHTLSYSFSRSKLISEHPYGYLHEISAAVGEHKGMGSSRELIEAVREPKAQVRRMAEDRDVLRGLTSAMLVNPILQAKVIDLLRSSGGEREGPDEADIAASA